MKAANEITVDRKIDVHHVCFMTVYRLCIIMTVLTCIILR